MLLTFRILTTLAVSAPALASEPALAAQKKAPASPDAVRAADEIVVTGERTAYGAKSTTSATRTNTPLKDIPQSLSVITKAQIDDQDLRSVAELLTFIPGAMPGTGEANRDQITLRGNNTTADFFVDGLRDDVQYFRDFYNVERVEVLKGPNAMIFGRGGGGGVVNRVTKRASLTNSRDFALQGDSAGGYRTTADFDQALAPNAGLRINGMFEHGESFRNHVELKRYAINPTLGILVGPATRIDIGLEYLHDRRITDRGVPSRDGLPLRGFDKTFFGDPDRSYAEADVRVGTFGLRHDFGGGLTLRNQTLVGSYDKFYQNVFPNSPVTASDTVRLSGYNDTTERSNLFTQTDLIWEGRVAGFDQTLLFGFELGRQRGSNQRRNAAFSAAGTTPAFIEVPLSAVTLDVQPIRFLSPATDNGVKANVVAVYAQGQIRPFRWLEIVAGLRFDRFHSAIESRLTGSRFGQSEELWSPRLGLILKPLQNLSFYASYSRSYLPQSGDQFSSLAANTETLKPEKFDNFELGGKWELLNGLLATVAVYRLDRTNTRATDPTDPTRFVLTGAQRTEGLEIGLERSVSARWQISGGYAMQNSEITKTTAAAPAGRNVPLVPRHQFSLWNRYDLSDRFGLGAGIVARSKVYASISNNVRLPGYTRVDAAAYYKIGPKVRAQLNVENLFGTDYFSSAHNDNNIAPGAPRSVRAALRFDF